MKRLLSTILTICIMVSLFAVPVMATETEETTTYATEITYGSVTLNNSTPYLHASNDRTKGQQIKATANTSEDGYFLLAQFDATKGTLTYKNGYALETKEGTIEPMMNHNAYTGMVLNSEDGVKYGIKAIGNLTIDLGEYNNFLYINWSGDLKDVNVRGIDVVGDLTIKGTTGMINITGSAPHDSNADDEIKYTNYALNATGNINLLGGTVFVYNAPYGMGLANGTATYINAGGNINLAGATLKFRAGKFASYVTHMNKNPEISGYYNIEDNKNLEMAGNNLNALGYTQDKGDDYNNGMNKTYTPTTGPATEVLYGGHKLDATNKYLITNKTKVGTSQRVSATDEVGETEFVLAEFDAATSTLTYKNGYTPETRTDAVDPELSYNGSLDLVLTEDGATKYGIIANGDLTIDLGSYHNAFYVNWNAGVENVNIRNIDVDGDLTIKGTTGSIKMAANAPYDTTPNDGDAPMTGYGISATGDINLLGGTIYVFEHSYRSPASGDGVTFINAGGNINYNGAKVKFRVRKDNTYVSHTNKTPNVAAFYEIEENTNLDMTGTDKTMGFVADNGASYGNTRNKTYIPVGLYIEVGNNNVKLGGAEARYLHWTTRDNDARANNVYEANDVAEGASAVYEPETRTLKILEDNFYLVDYYKNSGGAAIEAEAPLTIDTNGKNFYVVSYYNGCGDAIYAKGDVKLTGTGSILAAIAGSMMSASGISAAVHSDTKVIVDTKGHILTANDKIGADDPRGYVFNAPTVEFTENANVKMGTSVQSWTDEWKENPVYYPGRIFHSNVTSVVIPGEADAIVCNEMLADLWTGFGEPNNTAKTYTEDSIKNANYMSIATTDKTISVDSVTIAEGNVKVILSKGCGLSADAENPAVCIIAAGYDASGVLIGSDVYSGTADGEEQTLTIGDADTVIVYLWNSTTGMQPIKKARIY